MRPGRGAPTWSGMDANPIDARREQARILIVDDDPAVRNTIAQLLREEGYDTTVVDKAEEGLALAKAEQYPLVITDMRMPGQDGASLRDRLHEARSDTVIIMLTA